ncbi:hypothetical protein NQ314_012056 [Rhamnusium bicolor]|uniref:Uncharacterized protein n=1 Tax=Rhamnusium bicolor TaxID=1586634 RepID=A0AAV8XE85_9CUCU|nr:hypothetical protein NQ314_012056 [Rhamnusium bicolor]
MEEKFNLHVDEQEANNMNPALVGEYSEPTDAAVHLYSELKNKTEKINNSKHTDSLKSNSSAKVVFRPLPNKPDTNLLIKAGPSSKI